MPTPTHVNSAADTYIQNQDTVFGDGTDGSTALKATPTVSIAKKTIWDGTAFQLSKQAVSGAITALTGIDSTLTIAQYLATIPTLTDTNWRSLLLSVRGELVTSNIDLTGASTSITVVDSGSTTVTGQSNQSIITGTPTSGSFGAIAPSGDSSFSARVSGTFVGTLQFERTVDNVSWFPISADVAGTNFSTSQATSVGSFHGNASSCSGVRLRCLTLISGSPIVQFTTGAGVNTTRVGNPLRLFDAVSGMLATIKAASTPATATDTAIVVDVRNYPAPAIQTVSIASGTSLSSGFAINSAFPVALNVPTGWTTANITFQGSLDGGTTYASARTSGGSEITINVSTAGDIYTLNPIDFAAFTHLKIRSGIAATPISQVSAASLVLSTRGAL